MKRIVFLTPPDARHGFSLTGVRQQVADPRSLETALLELTSDPGVAVVVVDERLIEPAVQDRLTWLERRWSGLLVVLPAPEPRAETGEDYALRLIRRAIGYQVRLNL
jgi:V/A-type H+-transporting ATPase subunit F